MKDEFELIVGEDGTISTIYQDGIESLAEDMGASLTRVCRASQVEWEDFGQDMSGWTVKANHDLALAIRLINADSRFKAVASPVFKSEYLCVSREGALAVFPDRETAIKFEIEFFWKLLEQEK